MFSYPDVVVVCGELEYHDAFLDVILNPTASIEILSPSTEAFDRGEKFLRYQRWNPTLKDCVLISQHAPVVEKFSRQSDGRWEYEAFLGIETTVRISSIRCELKLADLYDRVTFDELADSATASPPPPR
jgi:Uma2 family endonuclease